MKKLVLVFVVGLHFSSILFASPRSCGFALNLKNKIAAACLLASAAIPGCKAFREEAMSGGYDETHLQYDGQFRGDYLNAMGDLSLDREDRLWARHMFLQEEFSATEERLEQAESLLAKGNVNDPAVDTSRTEARQKINDFLLVYTRDQSLPNDPPDSAIVAEDESFVYKDWPWLRYVYGRPDALRRASHHEEGARFGIRAFLTLIGIGAPYTVPELLTTFLHDVFLGWNYVDVMDGSQYERALALETRLNNIDRRVNLARNSSQVFGASHVLVLRYNLPAETDLLEVYRRQIASGHLPGRKASTDEDLATGTSSFFGSDNSGTFQRLWLKFRERIRRAQSDEGQQGFVDAPTITLGEIDESASGNSFVRIEVRATFSVPASLAPVVLNEIAQNSSTDGTHQYSEGDTNEVGSVFVSIQDATGGADVDNELQTQLQSTFPEPQAPVPGAGQ